MTMLKLPWGEERHIEHDVEQFGVEIMELVAEYYVEDSLIVVKSTDFIMEDDTFVIKSCTVHYLPAFPDRYDEEEFEQAWENFMLKGDE